MPSLQKEVFKYLVQAAAQQSSGPLSCPSKYLKEAMIYLLFFKKNLQRIYVFIIVLYLFSASPTLCLPNSQHSVYEGYCIMHGVTSFLFSLNLKSCLSRVGPTAGTAGQDRSEGASLQEFACWQSCTAPTADHAELQCRSTVKHSCLPYCHC